MSETNFTKGPWHVKNLDVVDSENRVIARSHFNWLFSDNDDDVFKNAQANAALIAVAPEMYDLLYKILVEAYESIDETDDVVIAIPDGVYSSISSLLRKSRGEK